MDLAKPRGVEFFLLLPTKESAVAAADEAAQQGWRTRIDEPDASDDREEWDLHCMQSDSVLTEEFIRDGRLYFEDVAACHGGKVDGWEADATKRL